MSTNTVYLLLPEIVLVLVATAVYLGGAFSQARDGWTWLAMAGLLLSAVALAGQPVMHWQGSPDAPDENSASFAAGPAEGPSATATKSPADGAAAEGSFSGPLVIDLFSQSMRWLILGTGAVFVLLFWRSAADGEKPELIGSLLLIVAGLMVVVLANDLVLLFVGLELVSIPTYLVLYLGRHDAASQEAAAKYFFLSVLSSAVLLYGFSFLYGTAGSTRLLDVYRTMSQASPDADGLMDMAGVALILIFAGLGFRIAAVPFHFYAPDVYQGTSHANAALLSVAPKIAGLAALVRVVAIAMPRPDAVGWQLALVLSVLTMTVGNLVALWQNNIRRMLAYSSIAHAGYMLIGLSVGLAAASLHHVDAIAALDGVGTMMFYLFVYMLATTGAFAVLAYLSGDERQIDGVDELAGLSRTHPRMAAAMAICMFSLTGLPPLAGFWGKLTLFMGALGVNASAREMLGGHEWKWFVGLAVAGAVNAAISAGYYLRVVGVMYFRSSLTVPAARRGLGAGLVATLCAAGVLAVGVLSRPAAGTGKSSQPGGTRDLCQPGGSRSRN